MVPCTKEETDEEVSISHPYVDITDKVSHKEGEKILALPVFTDGLEMEKCYAGKHEDMLYTYMELLKTVKELGASSGKSIFLKRRSNCKTYCFGCSRFISYNEISGKRV